MNGAPVENPKEGGLYFDLFDSPCKIQSPADLERHAGPDATDPAAMKDCGSAPACAEVEGKAVFLDGCALESWRCRLLRVSKISTQTWL